MADVALGKLVTGHGNSVTRPEIITDGKIRGYNSTEGFCFFPCPGSISLDLGQLYALHGIRILLWDEDGKTSGRQYKYCLEILSEHEKPVFSWETGEKGHDGWQDFSFNQGWLQARFIRLHAIASPKANFHVVQLSAYDTPAPFTPVKPRLKKTFDKPILKEKKNLIMHHVFISYAKEDQGIAQEICDDLEGAKVDCWIAPRNIAASQSWPKAIVQGIKQCEVFLLILTNNANLSDHVSREVQLAVQEKKPIIVLQIETVAENEELQYFLIGRQKMNLIGIAKEQYYPNLLRELKSHFFDDSKILNIESASIHPRGTEYIGAFILFSKEQVNQIDSFMTTINSKKLNIFIRDTQLQNGLKQRRIAFKSNDVDAYETILNASLAIGFAPTWKDLIMTAGMNFRELDEPSVNAHHLQHLSKGLDS